MGLQVYVDWVKLKNYMSMNIKLDSRFNNLEANRTQFDRISKAVYTHIYIYIGS